MYVKARESDFAHLLDTVVQEFPELMLGSYPEVANPRYRVKLPWSPKTAYLERACTRLLALFPADSILQVE